jgi:peptidoglycan hydrolase-like protein with peptidoglycan-binding domain
VHSNEEPLRAAARDLADPTHSRRSLRASLDRRVRMARRRRLAGGGRRAVVVAASVLALGAAGAAAHQSGGATAGEQPAGSAATKAQAGYDVRAVQRKLGVRADGVFGPQTRRALKRFQRRNGLTPDGVVGPATLEALGLQATASQASTRAAKGSASEDDAALLARIAECESGGDPTAVSPDGRYRGKYQFSRATWREMGGEGDPAEASEGEQDLRAFALLERQGPDAWPVCSKQ